VLDKVTRKVYKACVDIRQLRERLGLSRDALARKLGVSVKTIYLWEKGKAKASPMAQQRLEELEKENK